MIRIYVHWLPWWHEWFGWTLGASWTRGQPAHIGPCVGRKGNDMTEINKVIASIGCSMALIGVLVIIGIFVYAAIVGGR